MSTAIDTNRESDDTDWHARSVQEVLDALDTDREGLSQSEAERRLDQYGPNEIRETSSVSPVAIFLSQFQSFLIYVLVLAALLSLLVGLLPGQDPHYVDAGLILFILLLNGVFGFVQDYRAEQSMQELRELATPDATVIREGTKRTVDATAIVPGDVVVIEQGDAIPADARVIDQQDLEAMEASLTGESGTVSKDTDELAPETALAERRNLVFKNTNAVRGRGKAVIVETGMESEVGTIATALETAETDRTPFQAEVDELGRHIGYGVIAAIAVLVCVQVLFTAATPLTILLTAVTLAVAAVPEGLPAVVTLTLALGARTLVDKNALVRRLPVVESLGSVDVVLTDKTGTLTENQMTVTRIAFGGDVYEVTGAGLDPEGEFQHEGDAVDPERLEAVLRCGALCNNAELAHDAEADEYLGDPTEVAVLVAAKKAGLDPSAERVREIPFSSERKRMTVVVDDEGEYIAYTKGATETILDRCDRMYLDGEVTELTEERREAVLQRDKGFASDALRVLGFARKAVDGPDEDESSLETGLVFLGLQGMIDPPRAGVEGAVQDCRAAGIRVVMVTGDNLETAKAIGSQIGFDPDGALAGPEIEAMSDEELEAAVEATAVFARMTPEHKVRVLKALQANGHRVAMTGDGVNDAPSVRHADVGIAMGIRGTDVTRQASDMVLQDDNFVTIRDAIAEGRGIFDNIRKFVNYLLSANAGEVLVVFVGVLVGSLLFPSLFAGHTEALVLTPVMLLWVNLVTDGLPALALGADDKAENVMRRDPRPADEPVIDTRVLSSIGAIAVLMTATGLALFFYGLETTRKLVVAQTALFTFLVVVEMVRIQLIRSRYDLSPFSNRWLLTAIASSLLLQLAVVYTPLHQFFEVVPLGLPEWSWIGAAFVAFLAIGVLVERAIDRVFQD